MPDTFQDDFFADELPPPGDGTGKARTEEAPQADDTVERKPRRGAISLPPAAAQYQDLAAQLSPLLRMGVSTWSYPGWEGLVWDGAYDSSVLAKKGLTAYHQHPLLRTVCVDRTFWRPLTASQYAAFAAQVDDDFRFVVKCPAGITDAQVRSEEGKPRESNPAFLDPHLAIEHFVEPTLEGLGSKLGVLVFQLSPLPWSLLSRPGLLMDKLGLLLSAVRQALQAHPQVVVAVEVRDPELLTPALPQTLKTHGATFCLGLHGKMPPIEAQLDMLRALWPGPLVCRWNLNRIFGAYGYADAQKKHQPFNEILSEDRHTRERLARTIAGITGAGQPAFVTISNDAEGCAPRSIALLAQALASLSDSGSDKHPRPSS
ncbi:hypothetical protein ATN89_22055 [Comamonas thiooxydans]|uniref:DUF72 domain-containing protein n=1 Tax=Comamonas thiooxydans TaxID=363952 RepID=UPI0007C54F82|nr:DUF72 domain-containing protein [Comamonas thiooxydans]OAD81992.1 hypothetical protein ATN89_22055 [Comamonas thiooxydans]